VTKQPLTISYADCARILDEVQSKSDNYQRLWQNRPAGQSLAETMAEVRRNVDPDRPFFFGKLPSGINFAGDARDFPAVLHAICPDCNATLINGLIEEIRGREGEVFDIGTNIGVVAATLARQMGSRGHVHAFEPSPETIKVAAATLALNGLDNFTLTEAAVSDRDGEMTFQATPGNSAIASASRHDFPFLNEWVQIVVPMRRVDTLVSERDCDNLVLIKIDVEGHELKVLRGATSTIQKFKPTVVYEYTPVAATSHGWTGKDSVSLLQSAIPFSFEALIEQPLGGMVGGQTVPFPLPEGVHDQVNVFARPVNCAVLS
jgi:FkbM family methyltransferase